MPEEKTWEPNKTNPGDSGARGPNGGPSMGGKEPPIGGQYPHNSITSSRRTLSISSLIPKLHGISQRLVPSVPYNNNRNYSIEAQGGIINYSLAKLFQQWTEGVPIIIPKKGATPIANPMF